MRAAPRKVAGRPRAAEARAADPVLHWACRPRHSHHTIVLLVPLLQGEARRVGSGSVQTTNECLSSCEENSSKACLRGFLGAFVWPPAVVHQFKSFMRQVVIALSAALTVAYRKMVQRCFVLLSRQHSKQAL